MRALARMSRSPNSDRSAVHRTHRDEVGQMMEALFIEGIGMGPNVEGNRPAAPTATEDQSMNRRVRLTVRLGTRSCEINTVPKAGLTTECSRLGEMLDQNATVRKYHALRRDVVGVGGDLDEGKAFLLSQRQN
jgi:hypothetical protein